MLANAVGPGSTFTLGLPERAVAGAPERTANPPLLDDVRQHRG